MGLRTEWGTDAMNTEDTYERALEPWEIEERKNKALELMEEHDGLGSTIEQHKRQVRTLKLRQSTVDSRIRLLRHEVRSGKTLVDRQAELPYADTLVERPKDSRVARDTLDSVFGGGSDRLTDRPGVPFPDTTYVDDPDPEPPGPVVDENTFARMYPMVRTVPELWAELCGWALDSEQAAILLNKELPPAGTPAFDAVANWSRTEKARKQAQERARLGTSIPGLYIPTCRMPKEIADLLKPAPKKRGARPLTSTSADLPSAKPAKKKRQRGQPNVC